MYSSKLFLLSVLVISSVNCRHLLVEDGKRRYYIGDLDISEGVESSPSTNARVRRQAPDSFTLNTDGISSASLNIPIVHTNNDILSAFASTGLTGQQKLGSTSAGLALDNVNGHGFSLTGTHIPGFGNLLTAAGKVNLVHNDNHDLTASAFGTRNMPSVPQIPNFNTVGGGLDYMYKNKVGASVSAAHTDLFNRNEYNLGGKLNLFRSPSTSLDFNAGLHKFTTPFASSGWNPSALLTLKTIFL